MRSSNTDLRKGLSRLASPFLLSTLCHLEAINSWHTQFLAHRQAMTYSHLAFLCFVFALAACDAADSSESGPTIEQLARFSPLIDESSGLAKRGNFYWTINDSGNAAEVYQLDEDGSLVSTTTITNAENVDWESLAQDDQYLYIADTGNNFNSRDQLTIYKVAWNELESGSATAEVISFSYGDYVAGNPGAHNFDSEGLAVRGDELWLFTKNRGDGNTNLYRIPKVPGNYSPMPSQSLVVDSLVTAADIHPETSDLLLVSNQRRAFSPLKFIWYAPTTESGVDWDNMRSIQFFPSDQWEAVLWLTAEEILLTHENNSRGFAGMGRISLDMIK
ncbi:MAG: hypothetical protein MI746_13970 [Pseudomonadales bacterium]|nr:hypothetical protein [Pseudomonadales bacterium]